jgi:hypothetical protein
MRWTPWDCQGQAGHFIGSDGNVGDVGGKRNMWGHCWRAGHSVDGLMNLG